MKAKVYTAAFTATLPVQRQADTDAPKPPSADTVSQLAETVFTSPTNLDDADWIPDIEEKGPRPLAEIEMDYIAAKLGLSQHNSEWLTSFLKSRELTQKNVSATSYRQRQADFQKFYSVDEANTFTYSHDISGLVKKLGMDYIAGHWPLAFIHRWFSFQFEGCAVTQNKQKTVHSIGIQHKQGEPYKSLATF